MSAIDVKNLVKKFHGQTVLHGIDLEVEQGEVVAIIGPSGSGKTTLLRSINLLEQPEGGTIRVGDITIDTGKPISQQKGLIRRLRQHVGFVFQSFNLFPHRTVLENIIEGPVIVKGEPKEDATARARELLAKEHLSAEVYLDSHANMAHYAEPETVDCIVFNFGRLPGGDPTKFTTAETSLPAVDAGLKLLKKGGLMALALYYGKENGYEERDAILAHLRELDDRTYTVLGCEWMNRKNDPPLPIFIWKE